MLLEHFRRQEYETRALGVTRTQGLQEPCVGFEHHVNVRAIWFRRTSKLIPQDVHGDDHIRIPGRLVGERLGELPGRIKATLSEDGDNGNVEFVGRRGLGRANVEAACCIVVEHDPGRETPSGVVDAEERHLWLVAHCAPPRVGCAGVGK
jgi:hypothetical protein